MFREVNNTRKKRTNQPPSKCEADPAEGFYKSDTIVYISNVKKGTRGARTSTTTTEEQTEETEEQQEAQPKEKSKIIIKQN